jgi:hypothetical protein
MLRNKLVSKIGELYDYSLHANVSDSRQEPPIRAIRLGRRVEWAIC